MVQVRWLLSIQSVWDLHYPLAFLSRLCKSHTNLHVMVSPILTYTSKWPWVWFSLAIATVLVASCEH